MPEGIARESERPSLSLTLVIRAKAGIQFLALTLPGSTFKSWIPACAGMTGKMPKALNPGFRRNELFKKPDPVSSAIHGLHGMGSS